MFDQAWAIWLQTGAEGSIDFLNEQADKLETAETYHKLMKELYWQEKNVLDMVAVAQAGIDYVFSNVKTLHDSDPSLGYELLSWAKSMAYDLASFTWRGWDEPGIVLTAVDEGLGLGAAELNLGLAVELDKGPMRISRAYWMLGAQQLANGQLRDAEGSFKAGVLQAAEAGSKSDERLCFAFAALALSLQRPDDGALQTGLNEAKQALNEVEHGPSFVEQVETAGRVFG